MVSTAVEDDILILETGYVPDSAETAAIVTRTMARREEIEKIQREMVVLQARLDVLVRANDVSKGLLAPIRKLPPEILGEIFFQCILSYTRTIIFFGLLPDFMLMHKYLGSVCRNWRAILNSTPRLWSIILLDRLTRPELLAGWLEKSKSHPLVVEFVDGYFPAEVEESIKVALAMVCQQFWRTRALHVDLIRTKSQIMPSPGKCADLPMLLSLSIANGTGDFGDLNCPQLRSLRLSPCTHVFKSLPHNVLQNLEDLHVSFRFFTPDLLIEVLEACPKLVVLSWENKSREHKIVDIVDPLRRVNLHSLKSLQLIHRSKPFTKHFLTCLNVPSLESVDIRPIFSEPDPDMMVCEMLQALLGDDSHQLRYLHLFCPVLSVPDIHGTLRHLGSLHTLVLSHSWKCNSHSRLFDDLLAALSPSNRDFSSACPQLATVILSNIIASERFFDFVYRRVQSDLEEPMPGLVGCLKVASIPRIDSDTWRRLAETHSKTIHRLPEDYSLDLDDHFW